MFSQVKNHWFFFIRLKVGLLIVIWSHTLRVIGIQNRRCRDDLVGLLPIFWTFWIKASPALSHLIHLLHKIRVRGCIILIKSLGKKQRVVEPRMVDLHDGWLIGDYLRLLWVSLVFPVCRNCSVSLALLLNSLGRLLGILRWNQRGQRLFFFESSSRCAFMLA